MNHILTYQFSKPSSIRMNYTHFQKNVSQPISSVLPSNLYIRQFKPRNTIKTSFRSSSKPSHSLNYRIRCDTHIVSASSNEQSFEAFILETQNDIFKGAERLEAQSGSTATFIHDKWERSPGNPNAGYGITSVLEGGDIIEKGAVNISIVSGILSPERAKAMSSRGRGTIDPAGGQPYSAAAMSLVFHSAHPYIPTLRADVRLFEVDGRSWFGGGCDLTPFYLFDDDIKEFHLFWKNVCDKHDAALYSEFKEWCDSYFYIPARKEHRGVGGLFFDDLDAATERYDVEEFVKDVARGILPSWEPIVERQKNAAYTQEERDWQLLRRGRYLEFNLLYDRGVKFGLDGGRVESIMVSAPPLIAWKYNVQPKEGSEEERLVKLLATPRDWV